MVFVEQREHSESSLNNKKIGTGALKKNFLDEIALNKLPATKLFSGVVGNVLQGQGSFLAPSSQCEALYSGLAWSCSIVIVVSKDSSGTVNKIGLAHIDPQMKDDQIRSFFEQAGNKGKLEISIISGVSLTALNIKEIASSFGTIKLFSPDQKEKRYDSALVDTSGKIYYGAIEKLNDIDAAHRRNNDRRGSGNLEIVDSSKLELYKQSK